MITDDVNLQAFSGLVAASGLVVSKQIPLRDPPGRQGRPQLRPSGLGDLERLFNRDDETSFARVSRLSSAGLVYSVNKKSAVQPAKILRGPERLVLHDLHGKRDGQFNTDRSCPHCRLFLGSLYQDRKRWRHLPPIAVVNHSARVNIGFDPETNISEASIRDFQVIVPRDVASKMIGLAHPLRWADRAGWLFRRSDPVNSDGTRAHDFRGSRDQAQARWEQRAQKEGEAFILEDVVWPVNEDLNAASENIIRIRNWERADWSLSYRYSLECCLRSNFGIAWEPSGLDIDGGRYDAWAIPMSRVDFQQDMTEALFGRMRRRDLLEMSSSYREQDAELLYKGWSDPETDYCQSDKVDAKAIITELRVVGQKLESTWPELAPFYLMNISASKELHFTIPENGPIELWHLLTWTAPAFLFAFLNHAVCMAPHVLIDEMESHLGGAEPYALAG